MLNLDYLLELFDSSGCYDTQKSLRRASSGLISAQGFIGMHIVVESLRHSFALLYSHVHQFIMGSVVFDSHDDETDVAVFWRILSVDVDALPSVAFASPWFSNNQLRVISVARFVENLMKRKFVNPLLCRIGVSMRAVLASLCCGLHE